MESKTPTIISIEQFLAECEKRKLHFTSNWVRKRLAQWKKEEEEKANLK